MDFHDGASTGYREAISFKRNEWKRCGTGEDEKPSEQSVDIR